MDFIIAIFLVALVSSCKVQLFSQFFVLTKIIQNLFGLYYKLLYICNIFNLTTIIMDEKSKSNYKTGSFLFSGCMFIGLGLGMYFGEVATGVLIGMGIGFIAMGISTISDNRKNSK